MDNKNFRLARKELINISKKEKLYFPLYILDTFPKIWVLFHKRKNKRKVNKSFLLTEIEQSNENSYFWCFWNA